MTTMIAAEAQPPTTMLSPDDLPWATLWDGIELKVLRRGSEDGVYTIMNRFAPGVELPTHRHEGAVHAHTIAGSWGYKEYDWTAGPGQYVFEPAGSVHTLFCASDSPEPAVVLFVIEHALILLDERGNEFMTQDGETVNRMYADALAAAGIDYPDHVLP